MAPSSRGLSLASIPPQTNTLPSKVVTAEYRRLTNSSGGSAIESQPPSQTPALQARPELQPTSQFCPVVDVASVPPPLLLPVPEALPPASVVLPPAPVVVLPP